MQALPDISRKSWLMVAVLGFVWGSTFMVIEIALEGIPPFWLATGRLGFAAVTICAFWALSGMRLSLDPTNKPTTSQIFMTGALSSGVPFLLLSWGQQYVTSGFAGTSMAVVPLIVLPLAHFFVQGEQLNLRKSIGMAMGFAGVFVLVGADALQSTGADLEVWGRLACIGVAACYAVNSITIRRLPPVDPIGLTAMMMVTGTLVALPFALFFEGIPPVPPAKAFFALLVLGILSTAAMNLLRVIVIRSAGPTFMTLVNYQVPVWSVVLGGLILNEALPPTLLLALVLILSGLALSQWGALTRLFRR
ncbi:DMT family transporter [Actibacterium lipolyticum]|uniref:Putative inner membrane transporter YedA n=1 Tax=Actibacterium lipolyticum TaxID=1524263 RepID=A0A238KKL6_9RHOB|nr:DMT family transporter [Actibacterium lipolyticum]SMX43270.1 putative inner membrane transporter YedA [Actibacterium lipolyticum]